MQDREVCKNLAEKGDHLDTTLSQPTFVVQKFEERLNQYPEVEKRVIRDTASAIQVVLRNYQNDY